jgi:hypothetical protein
MLAHSGLETLSSQLLRTEEKYATVTVPTESVRPVPVEEGDSMLEQLDTPCDWFHEATRCYIEKHQGCPWCGGANRVYRSARRHIIEYHCGACDFFACHELSSGRFFMAPGRDSTAANTVIAV